MSTHEVRFQRDFYDRHFAKRAAAVRDQLAHPLFRSFNDRMADLAFERAGVTGLRDPDAVAGLGDSRSVRVLEVGCGEGLVADALYRTAAARQVTLHYTGVDVSASAIALAREHVTGDLLVGDAIETLRSIPPASQDLVVAKNLLHHLDDPVSFLREAGRVAGPHGRVVVFEPNLGCPQFLLFNVLAVRRERHYFKGRRRNLGALASAGMRVLHTEQFSWLPYELAFVIRYGWFRRLFSTGNASTIAAVSRLDRRLTRWLSPLACYVVWTCVATTTPPDEDGRRRPSALPPA